jgi:dynein heavy chain 1
MEWIETLPDIDSPEWSGLPNNAEKLLKELESNRLISELNKIQSAEDEDIGDVAVEKDGKKTLLATVELKAQELYKILPSKLNGLEKNELNAQNPIFRFLNRELTVASRLLSKVRKDLHHLIEMCKGNIKSTNELREIANDLFKDIVPRSWKSYTTIPLNVAEWIMDFRNRVVQLNKISAEHDFGKHGIWLGGLIFPEAYLTATRQYVAQTLRVPLDELILTVEAPKTITTINENDFVVSGISIEGAEWNYQQGKLVMTDNLSSILNNVILRWVKKGFNVSAKFYIPVYLNSLRKNLIFSVMIDNDTNSLSEYDWYQRGAAMISWNKTYDFNSNNS